MSKGNKENNFDEYLKYVKSSRSIPEEFDTWAIDNNKKINNKKQNRKREDDDLAD